MSNLDNQINEVVRLLDDIRTDVGMTGLPSNEINAIYRACRLAQKTRLAIRALASSGERRERNIRSAVRFLTELESVTPSTENHKLDTDTHVRFYEQDYYILSNFSSFRLRWNDIDFDTLEHAYHWEKFAEEPAIQGQILRSRSAHDAFKIAERYRKHRREDWDDVKEPIMLDMLYAKAGQHPYVARKLIATGDRQLVEDSWRDDFWGEGPNGDGQNRLGKLWMKVRETLKQRISIS